MNFLDIANSRYTTKKYDPTVRIDDDTIEKLKEILRLSPSSINSQPWHFTFVSDEATKKKLSKVSFHNENIVIDADRVVIFRVMDNVAKFEEKNLALLSEGAGAYYHKMLKPLGEKHIKWWMSCQVYLALGFFLSACASMGIDSTPMEGIQTEKYDQILEQEGYKTLFAVAIGRRDKSDMNQPSVTAKSRRDKEDLIRSI